MPTIAEVRQKYPQYQDLSDDQLADALHKKFYSDIPRDQFNAKIGLSAPEGEAARSFREFASAATQNPARAQYDALPSWQKPIVAASDIADLTANGLTMGWGNKAAAAARSMGTGNSYEAELADMQRQTQGARRRAGGAGDVAEIAGGLKTALLTAGRGLTLAGVGGTGAMTGAKGLALRSLLMGGEGTAYAAATGAGNSKAGEELDAAIDAAPWGFVGGVGGNVIGEAISAGLNKVGGMFNKAPPRVTVDELKGTASAAYKKAADAGVMFNQNGVNTLRSNIIEDLTQRAFDPANEPGVMPVIKRLQAMGDNVTLEGLESLRKVASNGYRPGMKSNNAAIGAIVNRIDDVVNAADPSMITMGNDPAAAASALNEARSYWGRARRLETVEGLVNKGELIGGSQKNQDIAGATKRQLRTILTSEGKARGFSKPEMEELRNVVLGTPGKRTLDAISGMLPTGRLGGLAQGSIGAANLATGNVAGLALQGAGMAAGYGAQKAGDAMNRKAVEKLTDLVARGGVVPAASKNALQRLSESKRDALIRLIMGAGINQTVTP